MSGERVDDLINLHLIMFVIQFKRTMEVYN